MNLERIMGNNVIKILPDILSNKIAAGEVVDRPSSVVKELVENALDAGAQQITVIIKDGGKSLIQVIDDGCGMVEADAILCFERHSTSKISTVDDLHNIQTLGFRGEALASIASVSRVEMKTRTESNPEGTWLKLEGGIIQHLGKTGCARGTSIMVKTLFFNTPARRKFLKSDQAEYRHILQIMNRFLLSHSEIAFTLYKDGQMVYQYSPTDLKGRIRQVFGEKHAQNLIPVNFDIPEVTIHGVVGGMDLFRQTRGEQFLFLNRRYILNKSINFAVISAYESMLPNRLQPFYVLFLEVNPQQVDVNVHPSKIEVRFEDERRIFSIVQRAVKEALRSTEVVPVLRTTETTSATAQAKSSPQKTAPISYRPKEQYFPFEFRHTKRRPDGVSSPIAKPQTEQQVSQEEEWEKPSFEERISIWQLHDKYIFSQIKSGLLIIDQHLAHERILYEQALETFRKSRPASQQQLFPKAVELSPEDYDILLEVQFYLNKLGFIVKDFGKRTVIIEAIPATLKKADEEKVLREIIDEYRNSEELDIRDKVAKSYACKSAIKAGDRLTQTEMIALIDGLFATQNPYFCPHGRPIVVTIPLEELDKRFMRL